MKNYNYLQFCLLRLIVGKYYKQKKMKYLKWLKVGSHRDEHIPCQSSFHWKIISSHTQMCNKSCICALHVKPRFKWSSNCLLCLAWICNGAYTVEWCILCFVMIFNWKQFKLWHLWWKDASHSLKVVFFVNYIDVRGFHCLFPSRIFQAPKQKLNYF